MLTFYLIRHGQKEYLNGDPALTSLGQKQAEFTAAYLKGIPFKKIIASPRKRTVQTAEIIAQYTGIPVITDDRLRERMDWGEVPGETFDVFLAEWEKTDKDRNYVPTHGDSSKNAGERVRQVIEEVAREVTEGNVLIVTHGGVIGDFLRNIFSDAELPLKTGENIDIRYLDILECSITIVKKEEEQYSLEIVNSIDHLPEPLI